jgi:hypothetical protein
MKNLIYQYWDGDSSRSGIRAGVEAMRAYANRIGAEYTFEDNPRFLKSLGYDFGTYTPHYGAFKPILQRWDYDNVLFADTDVFPVAGLEESIFNETFKYIGICRESWQTKNKPLDQRKMDIVWANIVEKAYGVSIPRDSDGNVIVYNSGVVLYSYEGIAEAYNRFIDFKDYVSLVATKLPAFYTSDQGYLHAMLGLMPSWSELDECWNSYVHYLPNTQAPRPVNDTRTSKTKFVHVQLRGADDFSREKLFRIVNKPVSEWDLYENI